MRISASDYLFRHNLIGTSLRKDDEGIEVLLDIIYAVPIPPTGWLPIETEGEKAMCECKWLDIETAPRDGTEILIYTRSDCFYVVCYDDVFSAPWRIRNDEGLNEHVPTHWRPLPKVPQPTKEKSA